jgi:hypothetical protein
MLTAVLIRPAARGGKFLGPDAADSNGNSAFILIKSVADGKVLAAALLQGGSGPCQMMLPFSRSQPIPTFSPTPPPTVAYVLAIDISEPTWIEVTVFGPLSALSQLNYAQTMIPVFPGVNIGTSAHPEGVVLEIPGLCVATASYSLSPTQVTASAYVSMMCGCKIESQMVCPPAPTFYPWPAADFIIQFVGQTRSGGTIRFPLSIYNNTPSTFQATAPYNPADPIVSGAVWAWQPSLGNTGWQQASPTPRAATQTIDPALLRKFPELAAVTGPGN